jgi:hypothetical protein
LHCRPAGKFLAGIFLRNETYLLRAVTKYPGWAAADVAELADALASKLHFWSFFRVALHHFKQRLSH